MDETDEDEDTVCDDDYLNLPPCIGCIHLTKTGTLDLKGWTCKAFPEGISPLILDKTWDHTVPLPYDNGYHFQGRIGPGHDGTIYRTRWDGCLEKVKGE